MTSRDKYYFQAKGIYKERVEREIEKIAKELREEDARKEIERKQSSCPHRNTSSYNHGYHEVCNDCGAKL